MVIEEWKNVPIAYRRRTGPYGAENKQLMEDFKAYLRAQGRLDADAVILGIALDGPAATLGRAQRYDVGLVVEPGKEPAGLPVDRVRPVVERYAAAKVAAHLCEFCVPLQ